ncbi:MAG: NYN domain-containing protein [Candidatus Lokiarchaeota archaeon]
MLSREKIMVFIDNNNLFHFFNEIGFKCDYNKLKEVIRQSRFLEKIILFTGLTYPVSPGKKYWLERLKSFGYEIKTRFLQISPNGRMKEKRIDVLMAIEIIKSIFEEDYYTAIIVSGDGDFLPVIKELKRYKKKVEVWSPKDSLAHIIRDELGDLNCNLIDDVLDKIKL